MALTKVIGAGLGTTTVGTTITTADNTDTLTLTSTDADASSGPNLNMFRNSSSPADNDFLGNIKFNGRNDNSEDVQYAEIEIYSTDVSDGTEDGLYNVNVMTGGSNLSYMQLKAGSGAVFNEDSNDIDFRVESNGATHMLFVQAGADCLGIKTTSPNDYYADDLVLTAPDEGGMTMVSGTSERAYLAFADGTSGDARYRGYISYDHNTDQLILGSGGSGAIIIDSAGAATNALQPAFLVQPSTPQSNFGADGNNDTIAFGTERFDQNSDFASNTFTAPVTGKYQLSANIYLTNIDSAADYYQLTLYTSNRSYYYAFDVSSADSDPNRFTFQVNVLADMDASDQAFVMILQVNGTAQTDIAVESYFSGNLVC